MRKRAKELGMKTEGIVYEGARTKEMKALEIPPFPDNESGTLEMVAGTLDVGASARFVLTHEVRHVPEGCEWKVDAKGIGRLTRISGGRTS